MKKILLITIIILTFCFLPKIVKAGIIIRPVFHTGLVGYWDFQEGAGTTANDKSGNGNTGTLTNMAENDWVDGKLGKALDFDGSNDYVSLGNDSSLILGTSDFTVSVWAKEEDSTDGWPTIIGNGEGAGEWKIRIEDDNGSAWNLRFLADNDGINVNETALSFTSNVWHHVVAVRSGTTLTVYLNGAQHNNPDTSAGSNLSGTDEIRIATNIGAGNNDFGGKVDEVRIYNRALSASEVSRLYKLSQPKILAPTKTGLVGYWSFEEGTGTKAGDMSGNGNTGTLTNMAENDWVDGKIGKALDFDGSVDNDWISVGNINSDIYSISLWFKSDILINKDTGNYMFQTSTGGYAGILLGNSTGGLANEIIEIRSQTGGQNGSGWCSASDSISTGWHHLAIRWNGSRYEIYLDGVQRDNCQYATPAIITGNLVQIGRVYNGTTPFYWKGLIDEVRIYNRDLDLSEIQALYNSRLAKINASQNNQITNGLVGLWSFNGPDMDGDTAIDRSGQGNNGTLYGNTVRAIGKLGQAVSLDGAGGTWNTIRVNDSSSLDGMDLLSVSVWVKIVSTKIHQLVYKRNTTGTPAWWSYRLDIDSSNKAVFRVTNSSGTLATATSDNALNLNSWYNLVGIYDGTSAQVYIDGIAGDSTPPTLSGSVLDSDERLMIGGLDGTQILNGTLDEVRIYNRALSAQEIQRLYNMGR